MIHIVLPQHLRTLARVGREVVLQVEGVATQRSVLDALEAQYPCCAGRSVTSPRSSADRW
jgi:molybdopterin synthase sulfur carrier subunit